MLVEKAQGVCKYPHSKVHGANMGATWVLCSWGQLGAHLGPIGPRWTPCWPHEPCYQGMFEEVGMTPVWHYLPARWNFVPSWASIHEAIGRLTAWSREVSKPPDPGLDFSNRSEIWQAPRQHPCRDACEMSERYDHYNTQPREFKTSRNLVVRRLTA